MKVFEGEALPPLLERVRTLFHDVKVVKPKATRDVSREVFVTGKRFKPPAMPEDEQSEAQGETAEKQDAPTDTAVRTDSPESGRLNEPPAPIEGWGSDA